MGPEMQGSTDPRSSPSSDEYARSGVAWRAGAQPRSAHMTHVRSGAFLAETATLQLEQAGESMVEKGSIGILAWQGCRGVLPSAALPLYSRAAEGYCTDCLQEFQALASAPHLGVVHKELVAAEVGLNHLKLHTPQHREQVLLSNSFLCRKGETGHGPLQADHTRPRRGPTKRLSLTHPWLRFTLPWPWSRLRPLSLPVILRRGSPRKLFNGETSSLHGTDLALVSASGPEVPNGDLVHREEAHGGTILGGHVGDRGAVSQGQVLHALACHVTQRVATCTTSCTRGEARPDGQCAFFSTCSVHASPKQ